MSDNVKDWLVSGVVYVAFGIIGQQLLTVVFSDFMAGWVAGCAAVCLRWEAFGYTRFVRSASEKKIMQGGLYRIMTQPDFRACGKAGIT